MSAAAALDFADLLGKAVIALADVRLLRYQARGPAGRTPFTLWRAGNGQFDDHQSVQARRTAPS